MHKSHRAIAEREERRSDRRPPGWPPTARENEGSDYSDVLRHHLAVAEGFEPYSAILASGLKRYLAA
jgi:hypothetical protein